MWKYFEKMIFKYLKTTKVFGLLKSKKRCILDQRKLNKYIWAYTWQ